MKTWILIGLMTLPGWAVAASGGYYFGGTVAHVSGDGIAAGLEDTSNSSLEDTRGGKTLFFGHRFLSGSALEVSYVDLGSADESDAPLSKELRPLATEGAAVNYVANLPVEQLFEVNLSLGLMRWVSEYDAQVNGGSQAVKNSGVDLTYGLGATRDLGQNCIGRVGWTRFQLDGEIVNVGSIGMAYVF